MRKLIRNIIVVTIISFLFQYTWEYWQCGIFYTVTNLSSHSRLMASATFGDIVMTLILYGLLVLVNHDINWIIKKWSFKEFIIIGLYAISLSFYFEISALYTGRWSYSSKMPLFPNTNIGLIPVIQLFILFPLTFLISKIIIKYLERKSSF
ncbi:hypothetical protein [Caloranaerobacter ferrireducens]|uniref:hypothetical protein n=1 Tax=Caloranaerobacter ferrireducens TaxID=1323370 RepID=UPI00084DA074|nr:hypothetical protein [Caloranaerobacter ferrireducens]